MDALSRSPRFHQLRAPRARSSGHPRTSGVLLSLVGDAEQLPSEFGPIPTPLDTPTARRCTPQRREEPLNIPLLGAPDARRSDLEGPSSAVSSFRMLQNQTARERPPTATQLGAIRLRVHQANNKNECRFRSFHPKAEFDFFIQQPASIFSSRSWLRWSP